MLRNESDKNDANYQITQWIQNEAPSYKKQLQQLTNSDLRKLVDYIAKDVRDEFHKLEIDKDSQLNLELLKTIVKYITLGKVNWHFDINSQTNRYSLTLGNMNEVFWVTTEFDYEKEQNANYYLINPARFVWKSDVAEIALRIVNEQSDWFFSNNLVSELIVSQDILNELKTTIISEFEDIFAVICKLIQLQNVDELKC